VIEEFSSDSVNCESSMYIENDYKVDKYESLYTV